MVDLRVNPYFLSDADIKWVEDTIASMTIEEKIAQLFLPVAFGGGPDALGNIIKKGVGGMMYRPSAGDLQGSVREMQAMAKIPLFVAANLEAGGIGAAASGTDFGKPLQAAACNDPATMGYRLGKVSCAEGGACGINYSFAPIVDIDMNWRNPITNLRTFGSDPDTVLTMGLNYMKAAKEEGLIVSPKHFPGDGVDECDQHLITTINSLEADEWMATYGKIYKGMIEAGAETIMVGQIAQPAWTKKLNPEATEAEMYMPCTLNPTLINGLIRGELGFNGMLITDATPMLGFTTAMEREKAVPYSIAAGMDMFLFNKSLDEDLEYMMNGYKAGVITDERLNEALTRILGTKAAMGLHKKAAEGTLVPAAEKLDCLQCEEHVAWAKDCADRSATLVKDTQNLLPISPEKYKRIGLCCGEAAKGGFMGDPGPGLFDKVKEALEAEGFEVINMDAGGFGDRPATIEAVKKAYDLAMFVFNYPSASNNTSIRIEWKGGMMGSTPWFSAEVPTMAISFANPYHMLDLRMIKTFINAYTLNDYTVPAVISKITGKSEFKGVSPVNPFCDKPYLETI